MDAQTQPFHVLVFAASAECIRYDDIDGKRVPTHSFKVELNYHSLLPPLLHGKDLHKPDTRDSKVSK